jgi:hypothetical protein
MKLKRDLILIISLLSIVLIVFIVWFINTSQIGNMVVISLNNVEVERLPLDKDCEYEIQGNISLMHIHVQGGYVCVFDSRCANQICVNQGKTNKRDAVIACIPNGVTVKVIKV